MNVKQYQINGSGKIKLKEYKTTADESVSKDEARERLIPENIEHMAALQEKLFAENKQALLIVLQAMDAAGKDGIIGHVMTGLNPQGTQVVSFKVPSSEENDHDYLWRIVKALPRRGEIGIFNRSHYEDVLVAKVHDLVKSSQMPDKLTGPDIWNQRYRQIRNFERYLGENGIKVIKFFLNVSKDEQRERLLDRISQPDKNWKFSSGDIMERKHWDTYMNAYEQMLANTASADSPWYIIPADNKWFSRYLVSEIVVETLNEMNPQYPQLPEEEQAKMSECKRILEENA